MLFVIAFRVNSGCIPFAIVYFSGGVGDGKQLVAKPLLSLNAVLSARSSTSRDRRRASPTLIFFVPDSGASSHMVPSAAFLRKSKPMSVPISTANGDQMWAVAEGQLSIGSGHSKVALSDVLHVPELEQPLLSIPRLNQRGADVHFLPSGKVIVECRLFEESATGSCTRLT